MRTLLRLSLALVVVGAIAVGTSLLLDDGGARAPRGSAPVDSGRRSPTTTTTVPPPTTTLPPGLPLPLEPRPVRIAWAGNSVAYTLRNAMAAAANLRGVQLVDRSVAGCGMIRGLPADDALVPFDIVRSCDASIPGAQAITAGSGADVVTWLSSWETSNRLVDGAGYVFGTPEADAKILSLVDEAVGRLTSGGARLVFILEAPPTTGRIRPVSDPQDVADAAHLNDLLRQYAAHHPDRTGVLDLGPIVCPSGPPCATEVDGITLRPEDGGHFSEEGAAYVAPRIADLLLGPA